jgi:hypothetical protein
LFLFLLLSTVVSSHYIPVSKDAQKGAPLLPTAGTEFSGHTPVDGLGVNVTKTSIPGVPIPMVRRMDLPISHGSVSGLCSSTGTGGPPLADVTFIVVGGIVIVVHAMVLPPLFVIVPVMAAVHEAVIGEVPPAVWQFCSTD